MVTNSYSSSRNTNRIILYSCLGLHFFTCRNVEKCSPKIGRKPQTLKVDCSLESISACIILSVCIALYFSVRSGHISVNAGYDVASPPHRQSGLTTSLEPVHTASAMSFGKSYKDNTCRRFNIQKKIQNCEWRFNKNCE